MKCINRSAFTLVELLVVIAIIGILIGMLLPAVQQVREAARRTDCSNQIRQLALASHNYEGTYQSFPPGSLTVAAVNTNISPHARLLPFMEQNNLFNLVDFDVPYDHINNEIARLEQVPGLLCASNVIELPEGLGGRNNYYANAGVQILHNGVPAADPADPNHNMPPSDGIFFVDSDVSFGDILDGSSNTALFSERVTGDGSNGVSSPKSDTFLPGTYPNTPDEALADALAVDVTDLTKQGNSNVGAPWLRSYHSTTRYWHVNTPNGISAMYPPGRIMTTASSYHPGGVHVSSADGSARFVSDSIELQVWRNFGSRNDGQLLVEF